MFRVPVDTVLRRAAVTSLLLLTTTLAACGDDPSSADAGPTTAAEVAPTSGDPKPTTALAKTTPTKYKYQTFTKEQAARITDKAETPETIAAADTKPISMAKASAQAKGLIKYLKGKGREVSGTTGGQEGLLATVDSEPGTTIMLYDSERNAARAARNWQNLIALNPGIGRADRVGSHLYIYAEETELTSAQIETAREFRAEIEKHL